MPLNVITASRLRDGAIVWLSAADTWSTRFTDASAREGDALAQGLAVAGLSAEAQLVVGVYQVEVRETPSGLLPVSVRERIRAKGPSVRPDFAYPSAQAGE